MTRLRAKEDAVTWRCTGGGRSAILKCYRGVFAALSAAQRCRKNELVAAELRAAGIPTPAVLAASPEDAAVLVEDVGTWPWSDRARCDAASSLRRLHAVQQSALSAELRELVAATEPNRARIALGVEMFLAQLDDVRPGWRDRAPAVAADADALLAAGEQPPPAEECRPVHGDYFRANLIAATRGVQIVDWDRFGVGDPAWDVAFLIGAEPEITETAQKAALAAYGHVPAAAERRLNWHVRCWRSFWALRALLPG